MIPTLETQDLVWDSIQPGSVVRKMIIDIMSTRKNEGFELEVELYRREVVNALLVATKLQVPNPAALIETVHQNIPQYLEA